MTLSRPEAPLEVRLELRRRQQRVDNSSINKEWKSYRNSKSGRREAELLRQMSGIRARCMYCRDSRGCDIEHFWPKNIYVNRAFNWRNHLWICGDCNRKKSNRFPCDASGSPLLIDPTTGDFWQRFILVPETGELVARWIDDEQQDEGALTTLKILDTINRESTTTARLDTLRRLTRCVADICAEGESTDAVSRLFDAIEMDDTGVSEWLLYLPPAGVWQLFTRDHASLYRRAVRRISHWPFSHRRVWTKSEA